MSPHQGWEESGLPLLTLLMCPRCSASSLHWLRREQRPTDAHWPRCEPCSQAACGAIQLLEFGEYHMRRKNARRKKGTNDGEHH